MSVIKNLLAIIGLIVVACKGYEFYCHYDVMRTENAYWRRRNEEGTGE